jgi:hypothetical protein
MTRLLPALHGGHAPINMHYAFEEALEAFEAWAPYIAEPSVEFEGRPVPISAVFGRMRRCSDLLPQRTLALVCDVVGDRAATFDGDHVTYAEVAFLLRALCVERLRN